MKTPISIAAFVGTMLLLNAAFPQIRECIDGWGSPSIGSQGACSHHGGVKGGFGFFFLLIGAAVGGYVFHKLDEREILWSKQTSSQPTNEPEFPPLIPEPSQAEPILLSAAIHSQSPPKRKSHGKPVAGKSCPKCGEAMMRRRTKSGYKKGTYFYGCARYPSCNGIIDIPRGDRVVRRGLAKSRRR